MKVKISGPSFDDLDPHIEKTEKVTMDICRDIMDAVTADIGAIQVAASYPSPGTQQPPPEGGPPPQEPVPGEPQVSLDTLAMIATLWMTYSADRLIPRISQIWKDGAGKTRNRLERQLPEARARQVPSVDDDYMDSLAAAYLADAPNRISGFSDEMWKIARAELLKGFIEGESIDKLRDRLRINVPKLSAARARTIARTEVISASNAGSLAMVELSGFTGTKTWLATEDERTRPTHRIADGQTVKLTDRFMVGGAPLHFPGDPAGPPEEIINCRCTTTYDLDDEPLTASGGAMEGEWIGVLTLEGTPTGDGRMFAPGSLTWADLPMPLLWQEKTGEGHSGSKIVGNITRVTRMGNQIIGCGTFDLDDEEGQECYRRVQSGYLKGISIDADSFTPYSVDYIYAEGPDGEPTVSMAVFKSARIRGATLCAIPAFAEAYIQCIPEEPSDMGNGQTPYYEPMMAAGDKSGSRATTEGPWDAAKNVKRLKSPMPASDAREMFAWIDDSKIKDGMIEKSYGKFSHHEVSEDGKIGAANLGECARSIGTLHGARAGTTIPESDRRAVYNHLARHLRDGGKTPPKFSLEPLTAAAYTLTIPDVPPASWFEEPTDVDMYGALTVTDQGRIYAQLAPAGVAHRSFKQRVTVPMGNVDYSLFMGRETIVEGGGRVVTGALTMDCGHASIGVHDPGTAMDHYDNACSVVATVRIGENSKGVWVAGSLVPGLSANQVSRLMACTLSGDWRPHRTRPGWREFAGALLVPVPGFAMARTEASVHVENDALVASTIPVQFAEPEHDCGCGNSSSNNSSGDLSGRLETLAASVGLDLGSRIKALAERIGV